jgi:spermidine/putrescine-binding protein
VTVSIVKKAIKKVVTSSVVTLVLINEALAIQPTLNLLAPDNYISPELIEIFEEKSHSELNITYYPSADVRDVLLNTGKFDLFITDEKSALDVILSGKALPLTLEQAKRNPQSKNNNLQNHAMELSRDYLGVAYIKDKTLMPASWKEVFSLPQRMSGHVLIPDNHDDVMDAALIATGASVTRYTETEIIEAGKTLRNFVLRLSPTSTPVPQQDYYYEITTSTNAYNESLTNPQLEFVFPGGETRVRKHYIISLRRAKNAKLSGDFIAMISSKTMAMGQAQHHHFPVSNTEASESLMLMPDTATLFDFVYPKMGVESQNSRHVETRLEWKKHYIYKRVMNQ